MGERIKRLRAALVQWWANFRRNHYWLDHFLHAYTRYKKNSGDYLAAAITYFSFLSLFPLILLGVSIAAIVLHAHPDTLNDLYKNVEKNAPGGMGDTIKTAIKTAVDARGGVGLVGLVGTLFTGLGWIANLRLGTELVWGHQPPKRSFLKAKTADLGVLAGLGIGLIFSAAVTAVGTRLSATVLDAVGLDSVPGARWLAALVGLVVALAADMVIFGFLLVRLPKATVPRAVAFRGALLAAVGFEILKVVGTYYIAKVASSPAASVFGSILGVLVFLNLLFRFMLICVAWISTAIDRWDYVAGADQLDPSVVNHPGPAPVRDRSVSAAAVTGAVVGVGAAGAVGAAGFVRRRIQHADAKRVAKERGKVSAGG